MVLVLHMQRRQLRPDNSRLLEEELRSLRNVCAVLGTHTVLCRALPASAVCLPVAWTLGFPHRSCLRKNLAVKRRLLPSKLNSLP